VTISAKNGDGAMLLDGRKGGRTAARDSSTTAARESAARPPGRETLLHARRYHFTALTTKRGRGSACISLLRLLWVGGITCGLSQVRSLQFPDRPKTVPMIRYQETARHFLPVLGQFFLPARGAFWPSLGQEVLRGVPWFFPWENANETAFA
jgi:hypothetical protein